MKLKLFLAATILFNTIPVAIVDSELVSAKEMNVNALTNDSKTLTNIILSKKDQDKIKLTISDFNEAYLNALLSGEDFKELLNGYAVSHLVSSNDLIFNLNDYNTGYLDILLNGEVPIITSVLQALEEENKKVEMLEKLYSGDFDDFGLKKIEVNESEQDFSIIDIN